MEFREIFQNGIMYVGMPVITTYIIYEFVKMLILNHKDKNGKN